MKVLHVVPSFGLGGMEKIICALMNALPEEFGQDVLVLNGDSEALKWVRNDKVQLLEFSRPNGNISYFKSLFQTIKHASPEILLSYNWGATDAIWLGRLAGVPHIIHSEHGFNVDEAVSTNGKRNLIRHIVYRLSSRVIVVSRFLQDMMKSQFGLSASKVPFIANGINTEFFAPNVYDREKVRAQLGIHDGDVVIGYFGRLDPVKNFSLFLEVCAQCIKMNQHIKVLLVGEGAERSRIEQYCIDHNLSGHFLMVGKRHNVLPYLQAMDIFLLTSFREQMPMSLLEAMSVGIPVVASAVGEIPSMLQHRSAGFVLELEEGAKPFVDAILALTVMGLRQDMGHQARNLVLNQFQECQMIRQYLDLFDAVTGLKGTFTQKVPLGN